MNRADLPVIGQPLNGGFFAGLILSGTQTHAVIVSPKEFGTGEFAWGEYGKEIEARSYSDGKINTLAMAENGSELGQWAIGLVIGEYNDWYIPARDELEIIYRNLKPTTDNNCCSFRDGDNPSAPDIQARYPYTPTTPGVTVEPLFQNGGSEALEPVWHWASTHYSAHSAWIQGFAGGTQGFDFKLISLAARAVRRELVI